MKCSEVKVKVTQNKTTPVKYRYLKNVLKYSNEVVVLRYWPPLQTTLFWSTNFAVNITVDIFGRCWSDAFVMFWIWLFQLEFVARIIHFIRLFNLFESVCTYVILIIVFNDVLMGGASWSFKTFVNILFSNHWFVAHVNHIKSMILPSHWFNWSSVLKSCKYCFIAVTL